MSDLHFDVVGADGPRRYFEALTPQRLSHAYLFAGPAGVGKKTFARRIAQSLLCQFPKEGVVGYCDRCSSCALFRAGAVHPDFIESDGVMKIGERDAGAGFYESEELSARDLVRQFSMQSYSGGMRVLLLGDVEFATHHAANALLKFLEEPPRGVVMILTTAAPGRLLVTIRSRLIELRFPLLSKAQVREILGRLHYGDADAELGASLGGGSVTRGISTLQGEEESLRAQVARWVFDSVAGKVPKEGWTSRETLDEGLAIVKTLVRDWVAAGIAADAPLVSLDYADRLRELRPLSGDEAVAILTKIGEAQRLARTNVSPTMVGEIVRMSLTGAASN